MLLSRTGSGMSVCSVTFPEAWDCHTEQAELILGESASVPAHTLLAAPDRYPFHPGATWGQLCKGIRVGTWDL